MASLIPQATHRHARSRHGSVSSHSPHKSSLPHTPRKNQPYLTLHAQINPTSHSTLQTNPTSHSTHKSTLPHTPRTYPPYLILHAHILPTSHSTLQILPTSHSTHKSTLPHTFTHKSSLPPAAAVASLLPQATRRHARSRHGGVSSHSTHISSHPCGVGACRGAYVAPLAARRSPTKRSAPPTGGHLAGAGFGGVAAHNFTLC